MCSHDHVSLSDQISLHPLIPSMNKAPIARTHARTHTHTCTHTRAHTHTHVIWVIFVASLLGHVSRGSVLTWSLPLPIIDQINMKGKLYQISTIGENLFKHILTKSTSKMCDSMQKGLEYCRGGASVLRNCLLSVSVRGRRTQRGWCSRVNDGRIDLQCSFIAPSCQFSTLATLALELHQYWTLALST